MPVIHAGGFSVVSFLGSSRLWCFLSGLKLHKNCHATQANMQARHECSTNMLSKQVFPRDLRPVQTYPDIFESETFSFPIRFRPHTGYFRVRRCRKMVSSLCPNNKPTNMATQSVDLVSLEWIGILSAACEQGNSIWIRYVWTGKFLNPERKSCGL